MHHRYASGFVPAEGASGSYLLSRESPKGEMNMYLPKLEKQKIEAVESFFYPLFWGIKTPTCSCNIFGPRAIR
jgi:hypothetical protein